MTQSIQRSVLRWIHLVFSIPVIGYVYSPFEELPNYAPVVRNVAVPLIVLTGLWMWKGHAVRRLILRGSRGVATSVTGAMTGPARLPQALDRRDRAVVARIQ
jgi:hypothetical protein